jgi:hypothetical protein
MTRTIHYRASEGVYGYREGDVLVCDDTGDRFRVVRDGRGLCLAPIGEDNAPGGEEDLPR